MTRARALMDLGDGRFELAGDLVFENAARVLEEGDAAFGGQARVDVDLARVGRVDSAGLALLLEWAVAAREAGRKVSYRNLPTGVSALAGISDVSELLDAAASAG
jgi:phospholipid transport system transporter-binding protein